MNIQTPAPMMVDEFLAWAEGRPGRYELIEGVVYQMPPERALHAQTKVQVYFVLKEAVKRAKVGCYAMPDGMTVRITDRTAFEPDALVYCGPRAAPHDLEIKTPVIVAEVLSPGTKAYDVGGKLTGYFSLPSIVHYLIFNADQKTLVHHQRVAPDKIDTRIVSDGELMLDPPGLIVNVQDFFAID